MTANVTIQVRKYEDVLKIPNSALRYRPSEAPKEAGAPKDKTKGSPTAGQRVYLLGKEGKPAAVPVKTGISDGTFTLVVEGGLKEGDALIVGEAPRKKNGASRSPPGMGFGGFR
jgi:HlyD family secretion protein